MTEPNKKQIRFPVQQQADKEPTQAKIQYGEFVQNTKCEIFSTTACPRRRFALCKGKFRLCWFTLFIEMLNVPPWMFALETEIRLTEVTVGWSWSANDQDVGYIPLLFPKVN